MIKKIMSGFAFIPKAYATGTNATLPVSPITSPTDVVNLACSVFGWMFWGLMAISVIMIVYAAFMYVTAAGEAEKVSKANKTLLYAAIGIGVALLARAIPLIVAGFLSTTGTASLQGHTC